MQTDKDTSIPFTRLQFPIKPAFGITANKSQGQTLEQIGIYLPDPMFTHGQFYVANSRVGNFNNLSIFINNNSNVTNNVVYEEIL